MKSEAILNCKLKKNLYVAFVGLAFSLTATGEVRDYIHCSKRNSSMDVYEEGLKVVENDPNNSRKIFNQGIKSLCVGKTEEEMRHIGRASDLGHIAASLVAALYHGTDGTFRRSFLAEDEQQFNNLIHYLERAAMQIESARDYPGGVTKDMPYIEEHY